MEEQKLTMLQRNKVNYHLRNGDSLPPTKAYEPEKSPTYEDRLAFEIMNRAKTAARRRSFEAIQASGAFEIEKYVPIRHLRETSEQQKIKLQQRMSGITQHPQLDAFRLKSRYKHVPKKTKSCNDRITDCEFSFLFPEQIVDFFFYSRRTVLNEIYERADWLAEMETLGEGKKHREVIQSQIAERLRMVKKLEEKRRENSVASPASPSFSDENLRSK